MNAKRRRKLVAMYRALDPDDRQHVVDVAAAAGVPVVSWMDTLHGSMFLTGTFTRYLARDMLDVFERRVYEPIMRRVR